MFGSYLLAQLPGWLLASIALWLLYSAGLMAAWVAVLLLAGWVSKDVLLFPLMRRFYQPQSAHTRILGETGTAVTDLAPEGFVRVHGELWQARGRTPVAKGGRIQVHEVHGLLVEVDAAD